MTALISLLCMLLIPTGLAGPPPISELPDLVERILPSVVNISSTTVVRYRAYGMDEFFRLWGIPQERPHTSLGSGAIIDKDGYVVTNNHVIAEADEVMITLLDKRQFRAKFVGKDDKTDLALLQIKDKSGVPANLQPATLGDSDKVRIAESVFAVGNPFGLQHTVTIGIISAKNRTVGQGPFDNFLQTDASINPGNSGGPLFNLKGEIIGVNTMIVSRTQQSAGLGFSIPVNMVKELVPDFKKYGRVPRPWLGVRAETMNSQIAEAYNLHSDKGVLIYELVSRGPGAKAGLEQGDIILGVDGDTSLDLYDVERALAKRKATDVANLTILRGKKKIEVKVKLAELPPLKNLPQGII